MHNFIFNHHPAERLCATPKGHTRHVCLFVLLCFLARWFGPSIDVMGQNTNTPPPPAGSQVLRPVIRSQGAPPPSSSTNDPLTTLMLQQPEIDVNSPIVVEASFDPPSIKVGQSSTYRILITAMNESVHLPEKMPMPPGVSFVPGGRGQYYMPIAQKLLPRTSINYRVTPQASGTILMPGFNITVYNKTYTVPAAQLLVIEQNEGSETLPPPAVTVEMPPGEWYVGQSVPIKVLLIDPGNNTVLGMTQLQLQGEGILVDMNTMRQRRDMTMRNGRMQTAFINEVVITPIMPGKRTFIAQVHAVITRPGPAQPGTIPTSMPLLDSGPVELTAKTLPKEGELPGFTGGIGTFALDSPRLSATEVRAGEPIQMSVTVKGEGNFARLISPRPMGTRYWQIFNPLSDGVPVYLSGTTGYRQLNFTLIPKSTQVIATPAIPFSYFDPKKNAYVDLTIPPTAIKVLPSTNGLVGIEALTETASVQTPGSAEAPSERGLILTGLSETMGNHVVTLTPLQDRLWFICLQMVPALTILGIWVADRRKRYLKEHPEVLLKRRARRALRKHRRAMNAAAHDNASTQYIRAAVTALSEISAPQLQAKAHALVCADILEYLHMHGLNGEATSVVQRLFKAADTLRYAGKPPEDFSCSQMDPQIQSVLDQLKARL